MLYRESRFSYAQYLDKYTVHREMCKISAVEV